MLQDDGILYLGTRPAQRAAPNHPFPVARRQLTGIALVVEKPGGEGGYGNGMIFRKANTSVVHIGRRPSSEAERHRESDVDKAMFRCAVVSRQHAKITFTNGGNVILVDLNSHHGTHIRKPGETVSRMLTPQTPTVLADGDVITFGKSVGKNENLVRPVVARVDLLYGGQPSLKPLIVPNHHTTGEGSKFWSRATSGRYGVRIPSPSSVSSSDDTSSHDSDVEEIPGPRGNIQLPSIAADGSLGQAIKALRNILPAVHSHRESSPYRASHSPEYQPISPSYSPWTPGIASPLISPRSLDDCYNIGFDAYSNDIFEDNISDDGHKSRSHSPMDLSSPSSEPFAPSTPPPKTKEAPIEPVVIGAWPASRASSPAVANPTSSAVEAPGDLPHADSSSQAADDVLKSPATDTEAVVSHVAEKEPELEPEPVEVVASNQELVPNAEAVLVPATITEELEHVKSAVDVLKIEVAKLHVHRKRYKLRYNGSVHTMTGKLGELDERIADISEQYQALSERLDDGETDIQAEMEGLQRQLDALDTPMAEPAPEPPLIERDEVKTSMQVLKDLVTEMTQLRDNAKKMSEELKEMSEAALKSMAEAQVQTSLKRKRSDDDEDFHTKDDVLMEDAAGPAASDVKITAIDGPSPPKRARRVVSAVVQTATAITLGAVVTWSALAFS